MKKFLQKYNLIIFIFLLSLIPVFWVGKGIVIAGGDDFIFLNPAAYFKISMWNSGAYINNFNVQITRMFPFGFFWWTLQELGLQNPIIQKIWLFLMWFIAGLGITYLAKIFFPKKYKIVSLFAIPFYFFNPFNVFIPLTVAIRYTHTFLPFALAFFAQGIKSASRQEQNICAIGFGAAILLAAPTFANPAAASLFFILPFLYFLFSLLFGKRSRIIKKIFFVLKTILVTLLFNIYWLWMFFYLFISPAAAKATFGLGDIFRTSSVFEIFRTLGSWGFAKYPYAMQQMPYIDNLRVILASYLLIFLALFSFLFIKKYKSILFFLLVTVISMFLIKGDLPPWREIFLYLFKNISLFKGYREPWTKFTPLLLIAYSMLFGFSCAKILQYFSKFKSKVWTLGISAIIASLLFIVGFPSISGFIIQNYNIEADRSTRTKVPIYWENMVDWFKNHDPNGLVLITPRNLASRDYMWETGMSARLPVEFLFLKNPIRYPNSIDSYGVPEYEKFFVYFGNLDAMMSENFLNYLNMLGIKYIIQENNILWHYHHSGNYSPGMMQYVLNNRKFLKKIKQFDEIDLYEVQPEFYRPPIYAANKIILTTGPAYGFSNWNKEEKQNFSLINEKELDLTKQKGLEIAHQIVLKESPPDEIRDGEMFEFTIPEDGEYQLSVNLWDNGEINKVDLGYQIDNQMKQSHSFTISRNLPIQKELEIVGYTEMFYSVSLDKINLPAGKHSLTLFSPSFKNKDFGGINFLTLNKYFSDPKEESTLPTLETRKINSTKFSLKIHNNKNPFVVNFAQNFDQGWKLYLLKDEKKYPLNAPHLTVNGINNGWYINPDTMKTGENYELILEYAPQKILIYTLTISIASTLLCLFYVLLIKVKPKCKT